MIQYKELWLLTEEEKRELPETRIVLELFKGWFLRDFNLGHLINAINLESKGAFDYAYPQQWADRHRHEWNDDWTMRPIWFYPHDNKEEGHLFGRPLRIKEMIEMLREQIHQEALELWISTNNKEV